MYLWIPVRDYRLEITPALITIVCLELTGNNSIIRFSKENFITMCKPFYNRSSKQYIYIATPFKILGLIITLQISQMMLSDILDDLQPLPIET